MSFNYNQMPTMMPMLANLTSTAPPPFLPGGSAAAAAAISLQHQMSLADYTTSAPLKQQHQPTVSATASASTIHGACPMDLETVAETTMPEPPGLGRPNGRQSHESACASADQQQHATSNSINTTTTTATSNHLISLSGKHNNESVAGLQSQKQTSAQQQQPTAALMFNGMLGLPGGLMMMAPGMMNMMDASAAMMLHHPHHQPQYPASMMAQLSQQQQQQTQQQQQQQQQQQPQHHQQSSQLIDGLLHSPTVQQAANGLTAGAAAAAAGNTAGNASSAQKELIACKSCTLHPPNPNAPAPTTRERPPGCRTVFVGGLPENIAELHIREVFERCGEITTLRLSQKNFCHIRFVHETSIDAAIYLSGYRIRLGNTTAAAAVSPAPSVTTIPAPGLPDPNCGRLHVDYAQARDDQYEWECKQRQLHREQRHRERCEVDRTRATQSPPPVVHYTELEAAALADRLKQDAEFGKAAQVLLVWLERGDCSKKNANSFYGMVQSASAHVRRLQTERAAGDEELQRAREVHRKMMWSMAGQFSQIEKVFGAASHKKVWDHFTKAQRKNIDLWKKQSSEIRSTQLVDYQDNDEMDMSDEEGGDHHRPRSAKRVKLDNQSLHAENENLRTELASYRSDADMVKSMLELDTDVKEKQLKVLQETIRNLQTQLLENNSREKETAGRIAELESRLKQANVKELLLKTKIVEAYKASALSKSSSSVCGGADSDDSGNADGTPKSLADSHETQSSVTGSYSVPPAPAAAAVKAEPIATDEARIIGLVSTFLVVHPFGASLDYIYSYVQRAAPLLRPKQLEEILSRYASTFSEEVTGVGAKIERKWKFCGFDID